MVGCRVTIRVVLNPRLYSYVNRDRLMTVHWIEYAQLLYSPLNPLKGILTGFLRILSWSFVRGDQPRSDTTKQIALALRDEVHVEAVGVNVIQIDRAYFSGNACRYEKRIGRTILIGQ